MDTGVRRLLLFQCLLVAVTSAVFLVFFEILSASSVWFGGAVAAVNALLLARCAQRDTRATERTPQQSLAAAYICVVQRFVLIALLFAFGLGVLKLQALALLAGFIAGQLVMVIMGIKQLEHK
ncbi:MAG TPA: ATP synthase subunit I [Gammaproteobacteria bacterium]|nr:ATP synthase subunit I [Gammaproteobacteria bacterium]